MPYYVKRGTIPPKRHTQFRQPDGSLYKEEHVSREGFSDMYSNLYHIHAPTQVSEVGPFIPRKNQKWNHPHRHHHFKTAAIKSSGDAIESRKILLFNNDVSLEKANITTSMDYFYRNGHHDEVIFIHKGKGTLHSYLGDLHFGSGDYIVIPRGIIWQMKVEEPVVTFIVESSGPVEPPHRYRNPQGQLTEWSPYCERDIKAPDFVEPIDQSGKFKIVTRLRGGYQTYFYKNHPFDIIGWDGFYFPWIFNINDFMPITGKVHMPPPIHQTFQATGMVICSFVPRLYDYHPLAIPAPYSHSNVDSEEVIYYVEGKFMSRQSVEEGSITFHPAGLPHGPQPGKTEQSIGAKETLELAVMVDTFLPLNVGVACESIDDPSYPYSWL